MARFDNSRSGQGGFTLVELLIVVIILGILAGIVVPTLDSPKRESEQAAFLSDLRIYIDAASLHHAKTDEYLEDAGSGLAPAGIEVWVDEDGWTDGTPLGGVWDSEYDSFGFLSGLGVHFMGVDPKDDTYMTEIDAIIDDGDLTAGAFRKIAADRFYFVIAESP